MPSGEEAGLFEPTILGSVRRYWRLVVAVFVLFVVLGLVGTQLQPLPDIWTSEASLVVQDPKTGALFDQNNAQPGRYVENQVAFIESTPVARRAAQIASREPGVDLTTEEVAAGLTVLASAQNDVIRLTFSADGERNAIEGVNAVITAYQQVVVEEAKRSLEDVVARLEELIADSDERIAALDSQIEEQGGSVETGSGQGVPDLLARQTELQEARGGASEAERERIDAELAAIGQQLTNLQTAGAIETQDPVVGELVQRRQTEVANRDLLRQQATQAEVDTEVAGSGVILASAAVDAIPPPQREFVRNIGLAGALGIVMGIGSAYYFALRKRSFTVKTQPEVVLRAPLLAEVPDFRDEKIRSVLPVLTAPNSASAEAFRFAASALMSRRREMFRPDSDATDCLVALVVSAADGAGKTVAVANTALTAAAEGARVLALDADLGHQGLSALFEGGGDTKTVVTAAGITANRLVLVDGGRLDLVGSLDFPEGGLEMLASDQGEGLLEKLRGDYDLVLIDAPPLLTVAYTSTLLGRVDGVIAVVPHGSPVARYEEVRDRVELTRTPLLGYLYNLAPLSREMASVSVRASTMFHRERLRSSAAPDEAAPQPSNGSTPNRPAKRSWRSALRRTQTPERMEPAAPALAAAVAPRPEPARPAAGNGSHVAVPQAPVLSELVLGTGASSELDDYLYATVLETLLGDRSGQMIGPAPEVKIQPFTPLLRIKDWPTLGTIVLRRLQTGLDAPSARTLEKELVVELDYPAADAAAAIDNWARERFFPRHVELTDRNPEIWHLKSSQGTFQALVDSAYCTRASIEQLRLGMLSDLIEVFNRRLRTAVEAGREAEIAEVDARLKELRTFHIALGWLDEGTTPDARIFYPWRETGAQPAGWHPQFSEGIRPNIAPIQRLGLLSAPVLSGEELQTFAPA